MNFNPRFFTSRWRILLLVTSLFLAVGAVYWLGDPQTAEVPFVASLMNHPFFSLSALFIIVLLLFGAHRRVVAPTILVQRTREVLYDFAMDCDDTGKLILKPRPATAWFDEIFFTFSKETEVKRRQKHSERKKPIFIDFLKHHRDEFHPVQFDQVLSRGRKWFLRWRVNPFCI